MTNRDDFFARTERRYMTIDVPEFGKIELQSLKESERNALEMKALDGKGRIDPSRLTDVKIWWTIACVVDEYRARMFTDADTEKLRDVDSYIIDAIYEAATAHVGLSAADQQAILGNSRRASEDGSCTD